MTRKHCGGVRNLEDIRGRCFIDPDTGCWHLRDSRGRPMQKNRACPKLFDHNAQVQRSARRMAWEMAHEREAAKGKVVAMRCRSWDCVCPAHLALLSPGQLGEIVAKDGRGRTHAKRVACQKTARSRPTVKLTPELAQWARESEQKQADIAHALGVAQTRISDIKRGKQWRPTAVGASVFSLGASA